jgi:peptidyl-prolyl cis-trans isomerase A (cyclophilin A)
LTRIQLHMPQGRALVELLAEAAPRTVDHVLALLHANDFAGSAFYRAQRREHWVPGREFTVLQGGPMRRDLPTVEHETSTVPHGRGTVSPARDKPGTASAELFVCLDERALQLDAGAAPPMDGFGFPVFGRVVEGLDVLERIHALPTTEDVSHPLMRRQLFAEPVPFSVAVAPDREESP